MIFGLFVEFKQNLFKKKTRYFVGTKTTDFQICFFNKLELNKTLCKYTIRIHVVVASHGDVRQYTSYGYFHRFPSLILIYVVGAHAEVLVFIYMMLLQKYQNSLFNKLRCTISFIY